MTRTTSCSKVSVPLIRENLRRYWAIPALGFLVYFLSGVFPILIGYQNIHNMASTIEGTLDNENVFFLAVHLALPIIAAVMLFRYLQSSGTMTATHSMPFSRSKLYVSNYITGLIMTLGPMILTGLILLAIKKPAYRDYWYAMEQGRDLSEFTNVFTAGEIGQWMLSSAIIIFFVYTIAVFAGIVTGNSLMHFVLAIVFNFLAPGLLAVITVYCDEFFYGFNSSGTWFESCLTLSPWLSAISSSGGFGWIASIIYVLIAVALFLLGGWLYSERKLERVSDPLVFAALRPILIYIATFLAMTGMSYYFRALADDGFFQYAGYVVGAVIGFLIATMIVYKSLRIFNLKQLRNLGIYGIIAVLILCSFNFDFYGFETRVPKTDKVAAVYLDGLSNMDIVSSIHDTEFASEENIQNAAALHKYILNNRDLTEAQQADSYDIYGRSLNLRLNYVMENGREMNRRYFVPYSVILECEALQKIYESEEYKYNNHLMNITAEQLEIMNVSSNIQSTRAYISKDMELRQLLDCLQADWMDRTFEDMTKWNRGQVRISMEYWEADENGKFQKGSGQSTNSYSITVDKSFERTMAWLAAHEEAAQTITTGEDIAYAVITEGHYFAEYGGYYEPHTTAYDIAYDMPVPEYEHVYYDKVMGTPALQVPESTPDMLVTEDVRQLQELLDTGTTMEPRMDIYYTAYLIIKSSDPNQEYYDQFPVFYTEKNAPDWIKNYFK